MLAQHKGKGVTGERDNLKNKPGRLSDRELSEKRRSEATGKPVRYRRRPTSIEDKDKFLDALMKYWGEAKESRSHIRQDGVGALRWLQCDGDSNG